VDLSGVIRAIDELTLDRDNAQVRCLACPPCPIFILASLADPAGTEHARQDAQTADVILT
jgi:hypothetical protein